MTPFEKAVEAGLGFAALLLLAIFIIALAAMTGHLIWAVLHLSGDL